MPWTPPTTIVAGQVLTAAYGNANIRDNNAYLKGVIDGTGTDRIPSRALGLASARRSQGQVVSVPNNTYTPLYFDTVDGDSGGLTSAFTDRLTIPVAGWYDFGATLLWYINSVGQRHVEITLNGTAPGAVAQDRRLAVGDSQRTTNLALGYRYFLVGDILRVFCSQTSGGALSLDVGAYASAFWATQYRDAS